MRSGKITFKDLTLALDCGIFEGTQGLFEGLQIPSELPYDSLAHWPPMTYRNNFAPTAETLADFSSFLEKENTSKGPKELQPWIPFCEGRCSFCYFPICCEKNIYDTYVEALKKALGFYAEKPYVESSVFRELYVGGGTPSVLSEKQIGELLDFCRGNFNLDDECQIKFTAATASLSFKKIRFLSNYKVSQLDVGIQTFDENLRTTLRLKDKSKTAKAKLREIRNSEMHVSIDLLYNLPGQTLEQWERDIDQALELEVESVDCYPLEMYPETPLGKKILAGELPQIDDCKKELEMSLMASKIFRENGYFPTCHNRYSRVASDREEPSSEVVGTGAGFFMGHIGSFQYSDFEDVKEYLNSVQAGHFPIGRLTSISPVDEIRKAMMMLYVHVPVNVKEFNERFGKSPDEAFPEAMEKLRRKGLIVEENNEIRLSEKGDPWRFNIAWEFFK